MITTPAVITDTGDIRIHNQEGARIPLFFLDDSGAERDMTGATVAFITPSGVRKVLTPGDAANELVLNIAPGDFEAFIDKKLSFIVRDETIEEQPVIWEGLVLPHGW